MAINFPSTVGQPTDGSFTHLESGVGYKWDGESWNAIGANLTPLTDLTAFSVSTNAAGSPALSYNINSGVFSYTPPDLSGYLTAETDTLDTVTGRGATTTNTLSVGAISIGTDGNSTPSDPTESLNLGDNAEFKLFYRASPTFTTTMVTGDILDIRSTTSNTDKMIICQGSGSVQLFYNGTSQLETGSDGVTVNGNLLYSNNYSTLSNLPNATTHHGMFAHVHAEGHGYFSHADAWTQLLDTGSSIGEISDVDLSTAPTDNQVLKWDNANSKWIPGSISSTGGGIDLTDFSVATNAVGTAALSYDNTSGVFTYTPPDVPAALSNIVDSAQGVDVTGRVAAEGLILSTGGQIDAAGCTVDFQSATISFSGATIGGLQGEISDGVDVHLNQSTATDGQILSWNATGGGAGTGDYEWIAAGSNSITIGDDDGSKTNSIKIGADDDLVLYYNSTVGVLTSFIQSDLLVIRAKSGLEDPYITCTYGGAVEIRHSGSPRFETTNAGVSVAGTVTDNKGELRTLPLNEKSTDYTLVADDAGKAVFFTASTGTITIPNGVFSPGHLITIINDTGTTQSIVQGTGLTMYYTADGSTGNRQATQRSSTTILFKDTSIAYISGTGLS